MKNIRNKVQLIGNLGNTPELKETINGKKYTTLSLATNSTYINKNGERIKDTQWHNLVMWDKQAEIAENYLIKGQEICVDGKLNYRSYEDNDGKKINIYEVIVNDFLMLKK